MGGDKLREETSDGVQAWADGNNRRCSVLGMRGYEGAKGRMGGEVDLSDVWLW